MKKTIAELSIDTKTLYDRLVGADVGENISYKDLSSLIMRDVQSEARGNLNSARRMAMRDNQIVFGVIIGKGLKRLSDAETAKTGNVSLSKIRRETRRGIKRVTAISDFDSLPNDSKIAHHTSLSVLGVLGECTKASRVKRIETKIEQTGNSLPVRKTLEAFYPDS